ncbi:MAG: heme exporter protein CcmD [Rhizobiaceae bacterium]|nr:heme exporter protein CcmD [Rhizobiaceae bacterium]
MFGEHAAFIIPSYLISFVALAGASLVIWRTHIARKKELARMEAQMDQANNE